MELAKEIITDVVRDRTSISVDEMEFYNAKLQEGLNEAEFFLNNGLKVSVHVVLGHEKCMAQDISRCKTAKTLEVWTLQIIFNNSSEVLLKNSFKIFLVQIFFVTNVFKASDSFTIAFLSNQILVC